MDRKFHVHVFHVSNTIPLSSDHWIRFFDLLPKGTQEKISRLTRWEDRQASLLGKVLLMEGLVKLGLPHEEIKRLYQGPYWKPHLPGEVYFNISHTESKVVCAVSKTVNLGIDLEKILPIPMGDFDSVFNSLEIAMIESSPQPLKTFYWAWTRKEAALKAEGKGLNVPLDTIDVLSPWVQIEHNIWYLKEISLDKQFVCHIATDQNNFDLKVHCIALPQ